MSFRLRYKPEIDDFFRALEKHVFTRADLSEILSNNRQGWRIPANANADRFIELLTQRGRLKRVELVSSEYPAIVRYMWGETSPYRIALSTRRHAYLSHGTALFLHGLTDQLSKKIYINSEQSPKPSRGIMSQEAINRAFSREQRKSKYTFRHSGLEFILLSGKNTGRLEVGIVTGPSGEQLEATKLERTLIDVTVRPAYAGGVYEVLKSFRTARERVSVNVLVATLKKLDYAYPYHQAIGFYMQKAGYEQERYMRLHKIGLQFDFHLAHGLKQTEFNTFWRLFVPKGI